MDQIILEQFLKTLADDVRVFVRERNPESSEEAAKLADGYLQARRGDPTSKDVSRRVGDKSGKHCLRCGKSGHEAKDCRVRIKPPGQEKEYNAKPNSWKPKRDLSVSIVITRATTPPTVLIMQCSARNAE